MFLFFLLVVLIAIYAIFSAVISLNEHFFKNEAIPTWKELYEMSGFSSSAYSGAFGDFAVHFIDVEQGDCALVVAGDYTILIDSGEISQKSKVITYIRSLDIDHINMVVASHPHSDHIGGLCDVLERYPAKEIIMPELTEENAPTTRVYEDLLEAIYDNGTTAEFIFDEAYHVNFDEDITLRIIAPVEQSDNLNDMSLICYAEAIDSGFAVLGDAEKGELSSVYDETIYDFSADVIAMGHHGSSTSVYKPFLSAVNADVAVISCGKDNSYGHPHKEALDYIQANAMTCLRTDESGNIIFKVTEEGYSLVK